MGYIFTILGAITIFRLWGDHTGLAILGIIAILYQLSSLIEMQKEVVGLQSEDRGQTLINMISTFVIIGLFIASFII